MTMRTLIAFVLLAFPLVASAQSNTAQILRDAQEAFQNLEFETAARFYNLVLSAGANATRVQRDTAQLYLGVSYEYASQRDDALSAFRAFVRANPCTPAPQAFGASVSEAFNQARGDVMAVGLCSFDEQRIATGETLSLNVAVTRTSSVSIVLRDLDGETVSQMMMPELNEGVSPVAWTGQLDPDAFSVRPTEYALVLTARDRNRTATGSDSVPVLIHVTPVDTLRHPMPLNEADFLLEERPMSAAYGDLGKGLFIGAGVAAASLLSYSSLSGELGKAVAIGGAVSVAGIVALVKGSSNRTISEAQQQNESLRTEWEVRRDSVANVNRDRLASRQLVIAPTGESR